MHSGRGKELYFSLPSSRAFLKMPRSPRLEHAKIPRGFAACFTHLAAQESRQQRGLRQIGSAVFSKSFIQLAFSLSDVLGHLHLLRGVLTAHAKRSQVERIYCDLWVRFAET